MVAENGPRTVELEKRFNERGNQIEKRLATLETKMALGIYIGGAIFGALLTLGVLVFVGVLNP